MPRDDEIFAEAIELPPADRAAYLDRACAGDSALRARVASLLAGHEAAATFLERSPVERPPRPAPDAQPGDVIGRYTLVRPIGEGGCGVVFLAEQTSPVRRHVALKVIKLGMDTRQVIARFEAERQALALMDHPDIARVFDAGTTDTGRPFFVMEFVDGVPITKFCDEHSLSMPARLELFARVCLALQHAHQKGIIHRDLKPSNILVSQRDGAPHPKIIDFGIAKATQGRLTDQSLVTGLEQFIGTPAYMSPEQAELRDGDIDTRSDVYSLGVLLYELLTGRPPYDPQSLLRAGVDEIRRIIREVEPPRPSTRVATLTDADRDTVAKLRRAAPLRLTSVLRGDLDWIVMRCLEKDRDRRYGTAHELADDVRRHLRSEPITARPPETIYRVRKFIARNRLACASAAAVAAALIAGAVVSVRQAVRATRAEAVARAERDAAQAAGAAEALARADAQRRQEQAEALLTFMLGDFRTELKKLGRLELLDAVGAQAMAYFAALDPRDLTDTALTRQAKALTQIGETRLDQARYAEAVEAFTTAHARAAALVARHPQDADMLFERAQAEYWIGFAARKRGDAAAERAWLVRYRDSTLALVSLEGKTPRAQLEATSGHHNLAVLDLNRGDLAAARVGFEAERAALAEQLVAAPQDAEVAFAFIDAVLWLGRVEEEDGNYNVSLAYSQEASSLLAERHASEPENPLWSERLAANDILMGNLHDITGQLDAAASDYARARSRLDSLVARDPTNKRWTNAAQNLQFQQASLAAAQGNAGDARRLLESLRGPAETLAALEPSSSVFTRRLASIARLEASLELATGTAISGAAARALELMEPLATKRDTRDPLVLAEYAQSSLLAGRTASVSGDLELARRHWRRTIEIVGERVNGNDWRFLDPTAQAFALLGDIESARRLVSKLRQFGYRPRDPLAQSTFDQALSSVP